MSEGQRGGREGNFKVSRTMTVRALGMYYTAWKDIEAIYMAFKAF